MKTNHCGRNFGSNEGVIDDVDEYLGDRKEVFYIEGISKLEQRLRRCIGAKGGYVEKNVTNATLGLFRSTGAENVLIILRTCINCFIISVSPI